MSNVSRALLRIRSNACALEAVQAAHQAALIDVAVERVERLEQRPAFAEAFQGDLQVHVVAGVAADVEGGVGGAEPGRAVAIGCCPVRT